VVATGNEMVRWIISNDALVPTLARGKLF
jgi:hypothetical protein